jgi:hypothetical protein
MAKQSHQLLPCFLTNAENELGSFYYHVTKAVNSSIKPLRQLRTEFI